MPKNRTPLMQVCVACKTERVSSNHALGIECLDKISFKLRSHYLSEDNHGKRRRIAKQIAKELSRQPSSNEAR